MIRQPHQQGYILFTVVVTLFIVAAIALLLNRESVMGVNMAASELEDIQAHYVAEAGFSHALWQTQNSNCTAYSDSLTVNFGAHSYTASVAPTSGSPVSIKAIGNLSDGSSQSKSRDNITIYATASPPFVVQPAGAEGKDSHVVNKPNDSNNKNEASLAADINKFPLLEFSLTGLPAGINILNAELSLYGNNNLAHPSGSLVSVHRMTESWLEAGVTYQTSDGSTAWTWGNNYDSTNVAASARIFTDTGWDHWDITSLVRDWYKGVYNNFGMVLLADSNIYFASYDSSDSTNVAFRPKLTITYACECGVACTTSPTPSSGYLDEFNSLTCSAVVDYIGSDGTLDWTGFQWQEQDTGDPCTGHVWLLTNQGSNRLGISGAGGWIERKVDLSAFSTATLKFDYLQIGNLSSSRYLAIDASGNGGSSWSELGRIDVPGDGVTYLTASYAIPLALVNANSAIRLRSKGLLVGREIYIDNVRIDYAGGGGPPPGPESTVTLTAEADSYSKADKLFENNGTNVSLFVMAGSKGKRSLLSYDVSSLAPGTLIQKALLRLYVTGNTKTHTIQVFALSEAWVETEVTWNNRTAGVPWADSGGSYTTPAVATLVVPKTYSKDWIEFDVTALVQEWVDGVSFNHGVILLTDQTKEIKLASRESSDTSLRPQLVIDYTVP